MGNTLIPSWIYFDEEITTKFKTRRGWGDNIPFEKKATGVLKIGSIYKQGCKYYPQVFLKECKYSKIEPARFESQLSDSEDEGVDTVF